MLNLTPDKIVLLVESGETTEIPASGYVARVETTRREISDQLHQCRGEGPCFFIPLIEETPTGIAFDGPHELELEKGDFCLLIVTREVAEAAHALGHPLWRRMVWPSDFANYPIADAPGFGNGWRSLHRVPQGGA